MQRLKLSLRPAVRLVSQENGLPCVLRGMSTSSLSRDASGIGSEGPAAYQGRENEGYSRTIVGNEQPFQHPFQHPSQDYRIQASLRGAAPASENLEHGYGNRSLWHGRRGQFSHGQTKGHDPSADSTGYRNTSSPLTTEFDMHSQSHPQAVDSTGYRNASSLATAEFDTHSRRHPQAVAEFKAQVHMSPRPHGTYLYQDPQYLDGKKREMKNDPLGLSHLALRNQPPQQLKRDRQVETPEQYNVRKAKIHAELWQQEIQKQGGDAAEEENKGERGNVAFDMKDIGEDKWSTLGNAKLNKILPKDWEGFQGDEECTERSYGKEEVMLQSEFLKRKEHNKAQIASFVKNHLFSRHRAVQGWKCVVNNFFPENRKSKSLETKHALEKPKSKGKMLY